MGLYPSWVVPKSAKGYCISAWHSEFRVGLGVLDHQMNSKMTLLHLTHHPLEMTGHIQRTSFASICDVTISWTFESLILWRTATTMQPFKYSRSIITSKKVRNKTSVHILFLSGTKKRSSNYIKFPECVSIYQWRQQWDRWTFKRRKRKRGQANQKDVSPLNRRKFQPSWTIVSSLFIKEGHCPTTQPLRTTPLLLFALCLSSKCEFNTTLQTVCISSHLLVCWVVKDLCFVTHLVAFSNDFIDHLTKCTIRYITQAEAWQTEPR